MANCWGGGWKALQEALWCGQEMTPYRISQGETFKECRIHWFIWRGKWRWYVIVLWVFIHLTLTLNHPLLATGFASCISSKGQVVGDKQTVMVCLYTYISIKRRYSRVTITIVPSVACQHTEGEYHLLTTTYTYWYLVVILQVHTNIQ